MDFDRLRFVSERADSSETLISATIPERAGTFQARLPLSLYDILRHKKLHTPSLQAE